MLLSAVLVAAGVCQAAQIFYTDRAAFQVAAGALATEGFNTQHVAAQHVVFAAASEPTESSLATGSRPCAEAGGEGVAHGMEGALPSSEDPRTAGARR